MSKIAVLVEFRIREEARGDWEKMMGELAAAVGSEVGNLCYAVSRSPDEAGLYYVLELYASAAALEAHKAAPHTRELMTKVRSFLTAPPSIKISDVVASAV